ncbi:tripartite motif-containing protein 45-like isoform X2 [Oncorhynchus mykiss]|uniref:tripartite motif-containing protein 45-like isoform X2 n=1 Tax=Oncorhynchus mykiss TaxID=8022 RepID=UPI001878CE70|nr:tripartite motif-containing protein 45-like isoform X2 [Oncorhynchus mykiss]
MKTKELSKQVCNTAGRAREWSLPWCVETAGEQMGRGGEAVLVSMVHKEKKDSHVSHFVLNVKRKVQRHCGTFHCCSFCSSGGSKEARCGCTGTMPGGFRGCGHGHKGLPGKPHWLCCGSVVEASDCLPQSVITAVGGTGSGSPRDHMRTVQL